MIDCKLQAGHVLVHGKEERAFQGESRRAGPKEEDSWPQHEAGASGVDSLNSARAIAALGKT